MTTLKTRFAALKLACDGTLDVAKVFASIDLVGDMEGQASEASLRGITVQNAMSLLARLLKERKLPWPIADFDKCQALRQLSLRVALVGEAANTLQDVKEAKAEFAAHTGRIEELIKATKRAGDDVSARVDQKLKKRQKDEEMEQKKKIKKQKADLEKIQKAKDDAEKKLLVEQKKTKTAEAKAAVGLPSSDWTIIKLKLRGHLDVPIINASDWPLPALDLRGPFHRSWGGIGQGAEAPPEPHQRMDQRFRPERDSLLQRACVMAFAEGCGLEERDAGVRARWGARA